MVGRPHATLGRVGMLLRDRWVAGLIADVILRRSAPCCPLHAVVFGVSAVYSCALSLCKILDLRYRIGKESGNTVYKRQSP